MQISALRDLPGGMDIEAAGESFYMAGLQRLARDGPMVRRAALVPDLDNPFDCNAVCVVIDGVHVGHLDRRTAIGFRPVADRIRKLGCEVRCAVTIVASGRPEDGGGPIYRVVLDLGTPEECLSALAGAGDSDTLYPRSHVRAYLPVPVRMPLWPV